MCSYEPFTWLAYTHDPALDLTHVTPDYTVTYGHGPHFPGYQQFRIKWDPRIHTAPETPYGKTHPLEE